MNSETAGFDRYQRQTLLPQIGAAGQARLAKSRVLLVGCGALGTGVATLLVRAGVGFLRIVDRDLVELSNLQRQVLFDESDARDGLPKAVAAARKLAEANSSVTIAPVVADLNAGNIAEFAGIEGEGPAVDLIIDGTDNVATRYLINDFCVKHSVPWIYGGCVGVSGRAMAVLPGRSACLRCIFPEPPDPANLPTCDLAGVLGPAAAAVAAIQSGMAMRLLIEGKSAGGLITLDLWNGEYRTMQTSQPQDDCPCCGRREFPFLTSKSADLTTSLCGRNAVQVSRAKGSRPLDLAATCERLSNSGQVQRTKYYVRCRLTDPASISLTVFPDGRFIVQGTNDPGRAKSLYARFIGT